MVVSLDYPKRWGSPAEVGAFYLSPWSISFAYCFSAFLSPSARPFGVVKEEKRKTHVPCTCRRRPRAGTHRKKPTICLPPRLLSASERLLNYIVQWEKKANGLDSRSNPPYCRRSLSAALGLNRTYISRRVDISFLLYILSLWRCPRFLDNFFYIRQPCPSLCVSCLLFLSQADPREYRRDPKGTHTYLLPSTVHRIGISRPGRRA